VLFNYHLFIKISRLLMSSVALLYSTFYIDKIYGECQIVGYTFESWPVIYHTVIEQFEFNKGYSAKEEDIINPIQKDRSIKKRK